MKIEVLFPEYCNLYGDLGNIMYLKACLPNAEFIETSLKDEPVFVTEEVDLLYMGSMPASVQKRVIERLMPYKERLKDMILDKKVMFFTGNAMEVFFKEIIEGEESMPALGLLDFSAVRIPGKPHVSNFYGEFNQRKVVGCKIMTSQAYGANERTWFAKSIRGCGINLESIYEGVRKQHFMGTYLTGPVLVMNPYLTQYILYHMGVAKPKLAFKEMITEAYAKRIDDFEKKKRPMNRD